MPPIATAAGQVTASALVLLPVTLVHDRPWTLSAPRLPVLGAIVGIAALTAFLAAKNEIDTLLARLQALSDDHFNTEPDQVTWADAGTLGHLAHKLANICNQAAGEGEYAEA